MNDETPHSIFDEAAGSGASKKGRGPKKSPKISPFKAVPSIPAKSEVPALNLDPQVMEMLAKAKAQQEEIATKIDFIQKQLGMSLGEVRAFLADKTHFKEGEWLFLQRQKAIFEEELNDLIVDKKGLKKQKIAEQGKKRKGKSIGSRKKWIPIP